MGEQTGMMEELEGIVDTLQSVKKEWITKVPGIGNQINKMLAEHRNDELKIIYRI